MLVKRSAWPVAIPLLPVLSHFHFPALKNIRLGAALKKKHEEERTCNRNATKDEKQNSSWECWPKCCRPIGPCKHRRSSLESNPPPDNTKVAPDQCITTTRMTTAKDKTPKTPRDQLVPQKNAQTINSFNEQTQPSKPPPPNCRNLTTGPFMFLNLSGHQIKRPYATRRLA